MMSRVTLDVDLQQDPKSFVFSKEASQCFYFMIKAKEQQNNLSVGSVFGGRRRDIMLISRHSKTAVSIYTHRRRASKLKQCASLLYKDEAKALATIVSTPVGRAAGLMLKPIADEFILCDVQRYLGLSGYGVRKFVRSVCVLL